MTTIFTGHASLDWAFCCWFELCLIRFCLTLGSGALVRSPRALTAVRAQAVRGIAPVSDTIHVGQFIINCLTSFLTTHLKQAD